MAGTSPAMTSHCSGRWYCKLDGFSAERLMVFLTAHDQDVEIINRKKPGSRAAGRISVVAA
jgi:hypothetical protein